MHRRIFWLGVCGAIITLLLGLFSSRFIGMAMCFVLIAILAHELKFKDNPGSESKNFNESVNNMHEKLLNIEDVITSFRNDLMYSIFPVHKRIEDVEKELTGLKDGFDAKLDKMAEKMIEIENRLNRLKKTFSAGVGSLDERISTIEGVKEGF